MAALDKKMDLINRGDRTPTPLGTATFIGLRGFDMFIQYGILSGAVGAGLLNSLGVSTLTQGPTAETGTPLDRLNLSPYRLALLSMSVGSFVKQAFWRVFLAGEPLSSSSAAIVSFFNTLHNAVNSFVFISSAASAAKYIGEGPESSKFPGIPLLLGGSLVIAGLAIETISEVQRAIFKNKKENQGKPYTRGLWSVSRHINYLAYTMWRGGYALAAGGWIYGGIIASFFAYDFLHRAIPVLEEYCENRVSNCVLNENWTLLTSLSMPTCGMITSGRRESILGPVHGLLKLIRCCRPYVFLPYVY